MNSKTNLFVRIFQYLNALDTIGKIMTVAGLVPGIVAIISPILGLNIEIHPAISILSFVIAFGIANFRIFETQADTSLDTKVLDYSISLDTSWFTWKDNIPAINKQVKATVRARLGIGNHNQKSCYVKITMLSVNSEWQPEKPVTEIEIEVNHTDASGKHSTSNPFGLQPGELNDNIGVKIDLPFVVPNPEVGARYLGSLSKLTIILGIEQTGRKMYKVPLVLDAAKIKQEQIESEMKRHMSHINNAEATDEYFKLLKQFWNIK